MSCCGARSSAIGTLIQTGGGMVVRYQAVDPADHTTCLQGAMGCVLYESAADVPNGYVALTVLVPAA